MAGCAGRLVQRTAVVCGLLLGALLPTLLAQSCRMDPDAAHRHCGLPNELSNFQGFYECDNRVLVGKPKTVTDIQRLVRKFKKVAAVGVGHSWWKEQFCSGTDENSVNIVMTELASVVPLFSSKSVWELAQRSNFPIEVDEQLETVTVAAGVTQRQLLDYLAGYKTSQSPQGWTLPTFSWFIDQTMGGVVSTGSHGSSLLYGSLSSAVLRLQVVLANGSLREITRQSDPHLFKAFMVSVGRLGVITELTLRIFPQVLVERTNNEMSFEDFVDDMIGIQDAYRSAKKSGDEAGMYMTLLPIDDTQAFWHVPSREVWRIDFDRLDDDRLDNFQPLVRAFSGPDGLPVESQIEKGKVGRNLPLSRGASFWDGRVRGTIRDNTRDGVFNSREAYLSMSEQQTRFHSGWTGYDQYEVSVPLEYFADCLQMIGEEVYGGGGLWDGFRTPVLIRFVAEEDAYLSNTNGGPRAYFNIEDYVSYNTRVVNARFQKVIELFRTRCNARMHWGKAGWNRYGQCFDGAREYPNTWCDFGCAVAQLDPFGKFSKTSDVWEWRAVSSSGQETDFVSCCSKYGFDKSRCKCVSRKC